MSISRFAVVRYVPDPRREEHVNIGVVVVSDDDSFARARFVSDWSRARRFGHQDIGFLKEFARNFEPVNHEQAQFENSPLNTTRLHWLADNWRNGIQFSQPRASVEAQPEMLLERLFATYVVEEPQLREHPRTKGQLVHMTREVLQDALVLSFPKHTPDVHRGYKLTGGTARYPFDLVAVNGGPLLGLDAFSFETRPTRESEWRIDATAQAIRDVRSANPHLKLAVLVIPPRQPREDYDRLQIFCRELATPVIREDEMEDRVSETVRELTAAGHQPMPR